MPCEVLKRWLEENSDPTAGESMPAEGLISLATSRPKPGVEASTMDRGIAMDNLVNILRSRTRESVTELAVSPAPID